MRPGLRPAGTELVLVSRHSTALYSGMVPGLVAGLYGRDACAIDLRQLCCQAGVTFLQAEITGLDLLNRQLQLQHRPALHFDRLSLDLGAMTCPGAPGDGPAQPVKPLEPFLAWAEQRSLDQPLRIRGGGAAAVELALAFRARGGTVRLLLRGERLQLGSAAANRLAERELAQAGITVERSVDPAAPADLLCTGSHAPAWLAAAGLPVQPGSGRVLTEPSLQVLGLPGVFACGDCGVIDAAPRPPSGVWAVRAAPLLAENLRRSLAPSAPPLRPWRPQRFALQLLGDGGWRQDRQPRALACYGPWAIGPSRLLWRWKDRIDRRFMQGFERPDAMADSAEPMACRGCAAKLPADPLQRALARLQGGAAPPQAVDAVVLGRADDGHLLLQSVDGFPALVDDPWLNGRLTALHACSDLWASGAAVDTVQALVTLPQASAALQEDLLVQTLAGVRSVLEPMGACLVGGHTLEGRDGAGLSVALTVNGVAPPERHWLKGPLQPGEALLLSRPIGTGVLFAAAMAGKARPDWLDGALAVMQASQAELVAVLARHGCRVCTDITGFGLLGHLGEMLAEGGRVELDLAAIPVLPGALQLLEQGIESSLAPANASALALLEGPVRLRSPRPPRAAELALLIDPQTCGPLLAAVPASAAPRALEALQAAGFAQAAVIAQVLA